MAEEGVVDPDDFWFDTRYPFKKGVTYNNRYGCEDYQNYEETE